MSGDGRSWTTKDGMGVYEYFAEEYVKYDDFERVVKGLNDEIKDLLLELKEGRCSCGV